MQGLDDEHVPHDESLRKRYVRELASAAAAAFESLLKRDGREHSIEAALAVAEVGLRWKTIGSEMLAISIILREAENMAAAI